MSKKSNGGGLDKDLKPGFATSIPVGYPYPNMMFDSNTYAEKHTQLHLCL